MKQVLAGLILAAATLATAHAQTFTASLTGSAERPTANNSAATGLASLTLDGNLLTYSVSYSGMVATASHLHGPAGADATAGVMVPFTLSSSSANTGLFSGTATITDTQKSSLLAGNTYVNVHSSTFPGGEIRGQVVAVPEPGTLALLAVGAGALVVRARRKA